MALGGPWIKFRKPMSKYPETPQQKKVKIGGLLIKEVCKGKKESEFRQCRIEVLKCAFKDDCTEKMRELKKKIIEEID